MVTVDSLNLDVLELIFAYLSVRDLLPVALVSRSFLAGVIPRLYRTLVFRLHHSKRYPKASFHQPIVYLRCSWDFRCRCPRHFPLFWVMNNLLFMFEKSVCKPIALDECHLDHRRRCSNYSLLERTRPSNICARLWSRNHSLSKLGVFRLHSK